MKKLLQIDSCLNMLSTGRITEGIGKLALERGWQVYIAHGARYITPGGCMKTIKVGSKWGEYAHFAEGLLLDNHGLSSRHQTRRLIHIIKEIQPDIVQLHCIHGYYINYKILFEYLNSTNIPVVWTFHDCWAFTGHCAHPVIKNCLRWKREGCHNCPDTHSYPMAFFDFSARNFRLKKQLFGANKNLHVVTVSEWLRGFAQESFLSDKDIRVIHNGVDVGFFHPCASKSNDKFKIIGVASSWSKDKGLYDFYKIREALPEEEYEITLVGLSQRQLEDLPRGINGIGRTNSVEELAKLYSEANVFVNPTYADSFPTVNMEAIACGTPVITYETGGSPEIIDEKTGVVVPQGNVEEMVLAIKKMKDQPLSGSACRERAVKSYDKEICFKSYIELYEKLISK